MDRKGKVESVSIAPLILARFCNQETVATIKNNSYNLPYCIHYERSHWRFEKSNHNLCSNPYSGGNCSLKRTGWNTKTILQDKIDDLARKRVSFAALLPAFSFNTGRRRWTSRAAGRGRLYYVVSARDVVEPSEWTWLRTAGWLVLSGSLELMVCEPHTPEQTDRHVHIALNGL